MGWVESVVRGGAPESIPLGAFGGHAGWLELRPSPTPPPKPHRHDLCTRRQSSTCFEAGGIKARQRSVSCQRSFDAPSVRSNLRASVKSQTAAAYCGPEQTDTTGIQGSSAPDF